MGLPAWLLSLLAAAAPVAAPDPDSGYLVYCPCMGRFGNQADQFLGSLAFAQETGRVMVVPPWILHSSQGAAPTLLPWDRVFNLTLLAEYHTVISMESFTSENAETVWPAGARVSFCYSARPGPSTQSCNAKQGSPFGPFWDKFSVSFDRSEMFGPLGFGAGAAREWRTRYPPSTYPVLALTGAPAPFPVAAQNVGLARFMVWTEEWAERGRAWVKTRMGVTAGQPWLGLHLRNGRDWETACSHASSSPSLFSSPQCLGYRGQLGKLTHQLCLPSSAAVLHQLDRALAVTGATKVFVASDSDHMMDRFLARWPGVHFYRQERESDDSFLLDLVLLGQSYHFIGNCVSSFSAFVKRERDVAGRSSEFWNFPEVYHDREEL